MGLWARRGLLAVAMPVLFLGLLEGGLRFAGYGRASSFLVPDAQPGFVRTNPEYASLFLPGNFDLRPLNFRISAHKAPNTVRIVVLGESAAQGVPVPSFAFAPQLRAQLRSQYPGRDFEVINTGIVAVNSHVIYQIAKEMAGYEPDLFLVYAGNNEVVGPYGPGCAYLSAMPPIWAIRASVFVRSTRTGQLLGSLVFRIASSRSKQREWGGMSMFVDNSVSADDPRLGTVYRNFRDNLRGIVDAASSSGAKVVLCTVVANLKDCPPFVSLHSPWLSNEVLSAWQKDFDAGVLSWRLGEDDRARAYLDEALRFDPGYADTHYLLGLLDLKAGRIAQGRTHLVAALHLDALRFRPDPEINKVIREVAASRQGVVTLIDCARELGADPESTSPPSGREILFEHVHFDWAGNYRIARLMARGCGKALFGSDRGDAGLLSSDACADALAYSDHERLPMLLRMEVLIRKPPFTAQLTHVVDEARMSRDIEAATNASKDPGVLDHALAVARAALSEDPENPALAAILEGIKLDRGDLEGGLALARRAAELLPSDFALAADEATILIRLGRFDEAESVLTRAATSGADVDLIAPVFAELWTRAKRLNEGISVLDDQLRRHPGDPRLRTIQASLRSNLGDGAAAEREYREVLSDDPASEDALEGLVALLNQEGRAEEAARTSLSFADRQPRNQANSLRAVASSDAIGDAQASVQNMLLAEQGGPVTSTFELSLALKLFQLKRPEAMMVHLSLARLLSLDEGNPAVTESIDQLIRRMRGLVGQAQ